MLVTVLQAVLSPLIVFLCLYGTAALYDIPFDASFKVLAIVAVTIGAALLRPSGSMMETLMAQRVPMAARKPQFAALRAAMGKDLARLKLLPAADIDGLNGRLEVLVQAVDGLKPESETEPPPPASPSLQGGTADTLVRLSQEFWKEFKDLVRIRRLDHPELPLLTPSQNYFLRQNLKLRLLSARLALLQRDEASFRADLGAARDWAGRYFNRQEAGGKAFVASLDDLLKAPVALKEARLDASLQAIRAARKGP